MNDLADEQARAQAPKVGLAGLKCSLRSGNGGRQAGRVKRGVISSNAALGAEREAGGGRQSQEGCFFLKCCLRSGKGSRRGRTESDRGVSCPQTQPDEQRVTKGGCWWVALKFSLRSKQSDRHRETEGPAGASIVIGRSHPHQQSPFHPHTKAPSHHYPHTLLPSPLLPQRSPNTHNPHTIPTPGLRGPLALSTDRCLIRRGI